MANTWFCRLTVKDATKHEVVRSWLGDTTYTLDNNVFSWSNRGAPSFDKVASLGNANIHALFEAEDVLNNMLLCLSIGTSPEHERIYSDQELDGMALEEEAKRGMETTWNDKDLPF